MKTFQEYFAEVRDLNEPYRTYHADMHIANQRFWTAVRDHFKRLSQKEYFVLYDQAEYELDENYDESQGNYNDVLFNRMVAINEQTNS